MKGHRLGVPILAFALALAVSGFTLTIAAESPTIVAPDAVQWTAVPAMGTGVQVAILSGDPKASGGFFTERIKAPAGTTFPPHSHPTDEYVTVISGTGLLGVGDKVDKTKATAFTAGGFAKIPAGVHHYAICTTDCVIQVSGVGPDTMDLVK